MLHSIGMYVCEKRMQVIDYVVTYCLEVNNRCLRYLAECDPVSDRVDLGISVGSADSQTVYAESLLARESRRLVALWGLVKLSDPGTGLADAPGEQPAGTEQKPQAAAAGEVQQAHQRDLQQASNILAEATAARRLALRLASIAPEDQEAAVLLAVARALPVQEGMDWDELNELFARDSRLWRTGVHATANPEETVLGLAQRAYRKGYKFAHRLAEYVEEDGDVTSWILKYGNKLEYWVHCAAYQIELFRPGLSEKGKSQVWYIDKLADTLRMRRGFVNLIDYLQLHQAVEASSDAGTSDAGTSDAERGSDHDVDNTDTSSVTNKNVVRPQGQRIPEGQLSPKEIKQARKFARQQLDKMDKRIIKLIAGGFKTKPKKFAKTLSHSVASLGVKQIATIDALAGNAQSGAPSEDHAGAP